MVSEVGGWGELNEITNKFGKDFFEIDDRVLCRYMVCRTCVVSSSMYLYRFLNVLCVCVCG
jgi:hypothetical protein